MIASLIGFLSTSVGGAVFGQISNFINKRSEFKSEQEQRKHEQAIAIGGQLNEYYKMLGSQKDNPVKHALGPTIWMLCATYCTCTLLCFVFPNEIVYTLDPGEAARQIDILWGFIIIPLAVGKVIVLTTGGVGYGLCHPIVFILSSVCTGIVARKLR